MRKRKKIWDIPFQYHSSIIGTCTTLEEVTLNLSNIIQENSWDTVSCNDIDLLKLISFCRFGDNHL